ncbi:MAG: hypothetical protein ACJA0P_004370, partial [Planctomycetota bacterium]
MLRMVENLRHKAPSHRSKTAETLVAVAVLS